MFCNFWWVAHRHIIFPLLGISLLILMIFDDHRKLRRVDVCQFGAIAITTTYNPLLGVIIVCTCEEVTKSKFGVPNTFLLVHLDSDTTQRSIVLNGHSTSLLVYPRRDARNTLRIE